MRQSYSLSWLFSAVTADGNVWEQTPEDRSTRFPEIVLTDDQEHRVVVEKAAREWARLDQAIRAGAERLEFRGQRWTWRTASAKADIADYIERGEVTEFRLMSVAHPEQIVLLLLRDDAEHGHVPGDMFIGNYDSMRVKVPFSLPDRLWRVTDWPGYHPAARPTLRLVYERDVTCVGMPGAMVVTDVAYRVGWSADVLGETVRHVLEVR